MHMDNVFPVFISFIYLLLSAKKSVAAVPYARNDVEIVIQPLVNRAGDYVNIRVSLLYSLEPLGTGDNAHELDLLCAGILYDINLSLIHI